MLESQLEPVSGERGSCDVDALELVPLEFERSLKTEEVGVVESGFLVIVSAFTKRGFKRGTHVQKLERLRYEEYGEDDEVKPPPNSAILLRRDFMVFRQTLLVLRVPDIFILLTLCYRGEIVRRRSRHALLGLLVDIVGGN
jgi:hypothetical protein